MSSATSVGAENGGDAGRDAARRTFSSLWEALEYVGRDATSGGYRRFAWTREDATLREWFAGEATGRGLSLTTDRAGNQWAWWGDPDAAVAAGDPGLVIGSHLDSVPDGGAFDGPLGVVSSFAALDALRAEGFTPSRPVAVVNFGDEEGARFGVACAGSRIITGALEADVARRLRDADGVTLAEAVTAAGRSPAHLGRDEATLRRIGTFVELHVEQGRTLADPDGPGGGSAPVAVGSSIWPHGRWRLELPGQANHAGTTRLADRDDPMLTLAAVVLAAREAAASRDCVATIGKLRVEPNGVNAIASRVIAWLDARGADEDAVRAVVAAVGSAAGVEAVAESFAPDTRFDAALAERLASVVGSAVGPSMGSSVSSSASPDAQDGPPAPIIGTGAGHDAGILSAAGVPAGMLFVRNPTGVSHSPDEHAEEADCLTGITALAAVVRDLAG